MPYRYIYVGLALIGLAAIVFGVALSPEGEAIEVPEPIEAISPMPGDLVPPQTTLEIDLEVGYVADITVDGIPLAVQPADQPLNNWDAIFVEPTGVYRWTPSPSHPTITEWTPGEHTVRIVWNTYTGLPDTGSFHWTFRVG